MLRLILITLSIALFNCACVYAVNYNVPLTDIAPVADANMLPGEWDDALLVEVSYPDIINNGEGTLVAGTGPAISDCSGIFYIKWDYDNLYIACVIEDDDLRYLQPAPGPYNSQDAVQICFNPYNDPQAVFLQEAAIFDVVTNTSDGAGADIYKHDGIINNPSNAVVAAKETATGHLIELTLSWSDFSNSPVHVADVHGIGLMLLDFDGSSLDTLMTDFGNGQVVIDTPTSWNTITLIKSDGCGTQGRYLADINDDCFVNLEDIALMAMEWMLETNP